VVKHLKNPWLGWLTSCASIACLVVVLLAPAGAERPLTKSDKSRIEALFSNPDNVVNNGGIGPDGQAYTTECKEIAPDDGMWGALFCTMTPVPPGPHGMGVPQMVG
jgi:hypothetical protein